MTWMLEYVGFVLAIAIGYGLHWLQSRQRNAPLASPASADLSPEYIQGLNYLLAENNDAAVDTLTQVLPVNSQTLETHLALGAMMRRRGEVGRAISVHQNLIARPMLSIDEQRLAQFELAQDYRKAGVLDRAENIFLELFRSSEVELRKKCGFKLLRIYSDEREWQRAIDIGRAMRAILPSPEVPSIAQQIGHFHCEIGDAELCEGALVSARQHYEQALKACSMLARANLALAQTYIKEQSLASAIRCLQRVPEQDSDYIPEMLPLLIDCYRKSGGRERQLVTYLARLQDEHPRSSVLLSLVDEIQGLEGENAAADALDKRIQSRPSLRVVGRWLDFYQRKKGVISDCGLSPASDTPLNEAPLNDVDERTPSQLCGMMVEHLLSYQHSYQCRECGFSGHQLHWSCPSCQSWGSVRAMKGLSGE